MVLQSLRKDTLQGIDVGSRVLEQEAMVMIRDGGDDKCGGGAINVLFLHAFVSCFPMPPA